MQRTHRLLPRAIGRCGLIAGALTVGVLSGCSMTLTGDSTTSDGESASQQSDRPTQMPMPLRFLANPAAYPSQRTDKSTYPPNVISDLTDGIERKDHDMLPWRIKRYERGFLVGISESKEDIGRHMPTDTSWRNHAARLALTQYAVRHIWNDPIGADVASAVRTGKLPVEPFIKNSTRLQGYNQSFLASGDPWGLWWIDLNTGLFEAHVHFADQLVPANMDRAITDAQKHLERGDVAPYIDELRLQDLTQADAGAPGGADVTTPSGETATPAADPDRDSSSDATQGDNDGDAVTLTVTGRGSSREAAIQAALAAAVREAGSARIQAEYRTRGNRLAEQDIDMVSQGVVVDHEVVRQQRRDSGGTTVFVNATVDTARAMQSIEQPSQPLWNRANADWQQLSEYQAQQRQYREWLAERTDAETVLDKGYTFQTIGVTPTQIGADLVRGKLAVWIAPNPAFWQHYERALAVGSDLARPGNAITVGRAGPMPQQSGGSCSEWDACSRLGFPHPIRIPASAADARAPRIRASISIAGAAFEVIGSDQPFIHLWQDLLRRPNHEGGFKAEDDEFFGRFAYTAGGDIHPVIPHVNRLNAVSRVDDQSNSVDRAMQWARALVPDGLASGPDNIYRRATQGGHHKFAPELAFDGGVVMTVEVLASSVEQLRSFGKRPLQVTVSETHRPPTAKDMR